MVDENPNDEYQLNDGDLLGGSIDSSTQPEAVDVAPPAFEPSSASHGLSIAQRNAMIVLGFFIFIIIIYKIYAHFFSRTKPVIQPAPPPPIVKVTPPPAPIQEIRPVPVSAPRLSPQVDEKIASLSSAGEGLRNDMTNLGSKVSGMQVNMQTMADKLTTLSAAMDTLVAKLNTQATEMQALELRLAQLATKPKPRPRVKPKVLYYVQALIPGRAWLITADGAHTITVRVGSPISGYGTVQMIDPNQGMVMTSSGRSIKFSHKDS